MKHLLISIVLLSLLSATGCGEVTYPKETLREAIIKLCAEEYNVDIDVSITGNTLAIYLPLMNLFDINLRLSEGAQEKVQDVLLGVSRVTLSTDADIKFYCIITQDVRIPEIQLVIIKYVDDIKRAFYRDISRGEYFKRTLIDMNENPQAKKEKAVMEVFEKMELEDELKNKVLDDFFRSTPSSLSGIGYWNEKFYIKDITFEEFLAEQMANRIKISFGEKETLKNYVLNMITGTFTAENEKKSFIINFTAEPLLFVKSPNKKIAIEHEIFQNVFEEASNVVYGYKFEGFDLVKMIEQNSSLRLEVSKDDIYLFKRGRLGIGALIGAIN